MTDQVTQLQNKLQERDDLVRALTAQLEQAAERLDRLQRSGGSGQTSGSGTSAKVPPEFLAQQSALADDVTQLLSHWDQLQLTGSLSRIEIQLGELRDLICQMPSGNAGPTQADLTPTPSHNIEPKQLDSEDESPLESSIHENLDLISALRNSFLESSDEETPTTDSVSEPESDPQYSVLPKAEVQETLIELPDAPAELDLDTASSEQFVAAIQERDEYTRRLIGRLREAELNGTNELLKQQELIDTEEPESIAMLRDLHSRMEEHLRLAEVSSSIERARLARESAKLDSAWMHIRKHLHKLGIDPQDVHGLEFLSMEVDTQPQERATGQRWRSMLGIEIETD